MKQCVSDVGDLCLSCWSSLNLTMAFFSQLNLLYDIIILINHFTIFSTWSEINNVKYLERCHGEILKKI